MSFYKETSSEAVLSFGGDFGLLSSDETKTYEKFWVK